MTTECRHPGSRISFDFVGGDGRGPNEANFHCGACGHDWTIRTLKTLDQIQAEIEAHQ